MAKRRRLTPLPPETADLSAAAPSPGLESKAMFPLGVARMVPSPIARVAGEAAAASALQELTAEIAEARAGGRLVQAIPLGEVDAGHLVRDRLETGGEEEMAPLLESLAARGQQVPIEVVDLGAGRAGPRYGLISGWRRLAALRRLHAATGEARFAKVLALLRRPEGAAEAYLAMVEENEIRLGLSHYERARIVARAAEEGVFPNEAEALKALFAAASRARRSKIGAFLPLYRALDGRLRFPAAIPERLGLDLARALEADPGFAPRLAERLRKAAPATAAEELALLSRALKGLAEPGAPAPAASPAPAPAPAPAAAAPAAAEVALSEEADGSLRLSGPGVTPAFREKLRAWLAGAG